MKEFREIYFHVGLGKVASTFLQNSFFPKLKGIRYIPSTQYRKCKKRIAKSSHPKILVSREFDRQLEREVRWFSGDFPQARVIILLRRHDDWIASQYRRHVKNGWYGSFEEFIDLENDQGFWKQRDLYFMPMLRIIEQHFDHRPFVFFYDDLRADPISFLEELGNAMGVNFDAREVSLAPVHTSFSDKQLLVLRAFCSTFIKKVPGSYENKVKHWLLFRPVWAFYHLVLYLASLVPKAFFSNTQLIKKESLEKVREFYRNDWEQVKDYADNTIQ